MEKKILDCIFYLTIIRTENNCCFKISIYKAQYKKQIKTCETATTDNKELERL